MNHWGVRSVENYTGVKFLCRKKSEKIPYDSKGEDLNYWAWIFSQLGLTPVHSAGAYGNMSFRYEKDTFIITRTGMLPESGYRPENYVLVESFDRNRGECCYHGCCPPSSECFLHDAVYSRFDSAGAVLHGHSILMNVWAAELDIPVTSEFCDYGTRKLAESALEILSMEENLIILRDHGFVAVGETIRDAGRLVLRKYRELLALLEEGKG